MGSIVQMVELEDGNSPRHAIYRVCLMELDEGYAVEISWGGCSGNKQKEVYYRKSVSEAREKLDRIVAAKVSAKRNSKRLYTLRMVEQQSSLW